MAAPELYGANASGKSNLVKALEFMKCTVKSGLPDGYTGKYCKINEQNKNLPSYFEIEVRLDNKYYAYGYEVILSKGEFQSEWLIELTSDNKQKIIFERDVLNGKYRFGSCLKTNGLFDKMNLYAEDIQDDSKALLLSVMNHNKRNFYQNYKRASILKDIYKWLCDSLDINYPNMPISSYSYMSIAKNVTEVCNMIEAFGTGITGYKMVEIPYEKVLSHLSPGAKMQILKQLEEQIAEESKEEGNGNGSIVMRSPEDFFILGMENDYIKCQTIQFEHGKKDILFELSEESDGTIRVLDLLEILLSDEGKTYVIDELDRCLHPSLTYKFVETFLQMSSRKNIQLIVTTHESRLLDFDLLRRDEIWFIDKRKTGASSIYSLEEYNARFDQKIDKAYLEGRYGGVPIFNSVFPFKEV